MSDNLDSIGKARHRRNHHLERAGARRDQRQCLAEHSCHAADFRRTAAHELWKAGNTAEDCMEVTGHATAAMFKRYADLFTEEERQARQREVQQRRREWRESQSDSPTLMPTTLQ